MSWPDVQYGPPVAPPADFEHYTLPEHSIKPLQLLHRHPLDERLVFYERPHVYTVDGVPTTASVTAVAHSHQAPFVASEAIGLMKQSRTQAWPRSEYVRDLRSGLEDWTSERGALLVSQGKTVASLGPGTLAPASDVRAALRATCVRGAQLEGAEEYTFERENTSEEITQGWSRKGKLASAKGTEGHWLAECYFNGLPCRWWEPELRIVLSFVKRFMAGNRLVPFNTEKEIVCLDADLAGSIDLILFEPATGKHHIVDHKRSDKLKRGLRGFGKMRAPLNHLDDCDGASYALQTSIYRYILERDYGMTIGELVLLSIHPDAPYTTAVPYLQEEVAYLMETRMELVRARRAVATGNADFRCALTGAPLVDAVRLADGRLAMEKAAQVSELQYEPADSVRNAFEAAVRALVRPTILRRCTSWRKRMPEDGLTPFAVS